jgi:hypothetical protein
MHRADEREVEQGDVGRGLVATLGIAATAVRSRAIASSGSTPAASCAGPVDAAHRQRRVVLDRVAEDLAVADDRQDVVGVTIVVPNRPSSRTVPWCRRR